MSLLEFKDYVMAEKVTMMLDKGVFVGTKNYFICVPSKVEEHTYSKITTTKYSFKGKEIADAVQDIINESKSVADLESNFLDMHKEFDEMNIYKIDELKAFKVQAGFLGSGIHLQEEGKRIWKPFIQALGKKKKEIRSFYEHHENLK